MNTDPFWNLIAECRRRGLTGEARDRWLGQALRRLPTGEIVRFQACLEYVTDDAFGWNLWAAADLLFGGWCSDDTFCYFQRWLVGLGRSVYETVEHDADALADAPEVRRLAALPRASWGEEAPEWRTLCHLAPAAYEELTGVTDDGDGFFRATTALLDAGGSYRPRPRARSAERWSVLDGPEAARRLPRLSAMFPLPVGQ